MAEQLSFDLPAKPALGRSDFFVSPANALAVAMIDRCEHWPDNKLALSGPAASGKTHLAHVWAAMTGGTILPATALADADPVAFAQAPVAIEDVPRIAAHRDAQTALFHLHNLLRDAGQPLLLTGRGAPARWGLSLPDLQSRVTAAQHSALEPPDDALLAAVLAKLFADRQVTPKPDVIPYLLARMDRSFAAATRIVDRLDRAALTEARALSRPLAARLLDADAA